MTVHREPATGYTSDAKQEYREKVWKSFARRKAIHYANVYDNAFILIMPGIGTEEIDTAVDYGMDPEKIICVHESAAHVAASAKWRKKYPKTPFYCCKISEVMEKLVRDKRYLTGANLDFCNNLSPELIYEVQRFMVPGIIDSGFVLQINIMAARESKMASAMIDAHSVGINAKMRALAKDLYWKVPANVDVDEFVADNTPVYGDIKCKRINALLGVTSAIEIVSEPINCFVDMQGSYVNNKAPMSHVSIIIGSKGINKSKMMAVKSHKDSAVDRISEASEFINATKPYEKNDLPDDATGDGQNLFDDLRDIIFGASDETKNESSDDEVRFDFTGLGRDMKKISEMVRGRIIEYLSSMKRGQYTTVFKACSHCHDMSWASSFIPEGGYFISRNEIYCILEEVRRDGIVSFNHFEHRRRAEIKLMRK